MTEQFLLRGYYNPATAQFLTRDPLDVVTRLAYGYVGDDPLNATDPNGLICISLHCVKNDLGAAASSTAHAVASAASAVGECVVQLCISHPVEAVGAVVAVETISGAVIYGGVLACATLIGCVVGAPLFVIGTAGAIAGGYLAYQELQHPSEFSPVPEQLDSEIRRDNCPLLKDPA